MPEDKEGLTAGMLLVFPLLALHFRKWDAVLRKEGNGMMKLAHAKLAVKLWYTTGYRTSRRPVNEID
jgi:hypothetical protein